LLVAFVPWFHASVVAAADTYEVQPGDTLSVIAERTGVDVETLAGLNGIDDPSFIVVGAMLQLPHRDTPALPDAADATGVPAGVIPNPPPVEPAEPLPAPRYVYTVQPDDTLSEIASRLGVSSDVLLGMNDIPDPNHIVVGTDLTVPASLQPSPPAPVSATPAPVDVAPVVPHVTYVVEPGDTLFGIARRFGVSQADLVEANGLETADRIVAGQGLVVPIDPSAVPLTAPTVAPTPTSTPTSVPSPTATPTLSPSPTSTPRAIPTASAGAASTLRATSTPVPTSQPRPSPIIGATSTAASLTPGALPGTLSGAPPAVQQALQYVGYPYVWGGTTPAGFDCSGFVYFIENRPGRPFPRDIFSQYDAGPHPTGQLQPGDLLFFQDTDEPGLSHVGIYMGNGQFVHAIDEAHGVGISSFSESYWFRHWYGATRLA
jgi:peptidoglycan endopeptidase LytE